MFYFRSSKVTVLLFKSSIYSEFIFVYEVRKWYFHSFAYRCLAFPAPFIYFSFFLILFFNFTILHWFCHTSTWIRHRYTRASTLNPPPSSLPVPSLWVVPVQQPQASSIGHRTWTGNSFHIWYYTCFNAILPNHSTISLSHRVQKTVLYIRVSWRGYLFSLARSCLLCHRLIVHIYSVLGSLFLDLWDCFYASIILFW